MTSLSYTLSGDPIRLVRMVNQFNVVGCLARQSTWVVIISSASTKFSYRIYQGPEAVLLILPIGLVFAYLHVKYGGRGFRDVVFRIVADMIL